MSLKMNLSVDLPSAVDNPVQTGDASYRRNCRQIGQLFEKLGSGNLSVGPSGRLGSEHAYGTIAISSASGTCTVVVNGTAVSVSAAGTDDEDGEALAAAINANITLNKLVWASYSGDTNNIFIQALVAGSAGNYTLAVTGTGLTASGAALTLGADNVVLDFRTSAEKAWGLIFGDRTVTGAIGAVIGGTTVTATAPAGAADDADGRSAANVGMRLIADAINANSTVNKWVRARTTPDCLVTLTSTSAGAFTITLNGIDNTITAGGTEDTDGAAMVVAVNANTALHGCTARYENTGNLLYIRPIRADKRTRIVVSGAGATTVTVSKCASQTISIDGVTADVINVVIGGVTCTITATNTDEDTQGALLVTAINALSGTHGCFASYASGGGGGAAGTLTITSQFPGAASNEITLAITGAGKGSSAVTAALLDGGFDRVEVECVVPGVIGNAIALVASGTGITTSAAAKLESGSESRVAYSL